MATLRLSLCIWSLSIWAELLLRAFQTHSIIKQSLMMSKQGSSKRPLQEHNVRIVVNQIAVVKDQLPHDEVLQQSVVALDLEIVIGHTTKATQNPLTTRQANDHVHTSLWCLRLPKPRAPRTKSAVKARIADATAPIFGAETGSVEVPDMAPGGKAQCRRQQRLSRQGLQNYSARSCTV